MAKNKPEGSRSRTARYRAALAARGIKPVQVLAPEAAHELIRQAAGLMTRDDDPMEPRAALRQAGGANEPDPGHASLDLAAELQAAKSRITQIEQQAAARQPEIEAAERQRKALEAERDAAKASEAAEREKAQATVLEAQGAARAAEVAQERAAEALQRAEKAETVLRQAQSLPGLRGRLVRWLAGDMLE